MLPSVSSFARTVSCCRYVVDSANSRLLRGVGLHPCWTKTVLGPIVQVGRCENEPVCFIDLLRCRDSPMKVLVTAFEPFGGEKFNASWEAVCRLPDHIGDADIVVMQVPVEFGTSGRVVGQMIERERPDAVLCCGVASGRSRVTPEYVAINHRHARIADNAGMKPLDEPVIAGAPDAYFATLPVYGMVEACKEAGIPAAVSYSAGTYCCNDLFYCVRHLAQERHPDMRVDFIHVPQCPEQAVFAGADVPCMASDMAAEALKVIIEAVL